MDSNHDLRGQDFGTRAIHAGQSPSQWPHGAVIPPICVSTTFYQPAPAEPLLGYDYSRAGNPTRTCLETCLASLEKANYGEPLYPLRFIRTIYNKHIFAALTFSSGLATTMTIVQGLLCSGQQVISCDDCYGGTGRYFRKCVAQLGIETIFVDGRQVDNFVSAVEKGVTKMIWIETPTNPTLRLSDIRGVVDGVKNIDQEIIVVVDNTFMSSYLQQPIDFGADIVMHSLTKYMNGHTDVVMGAMMTNNERIYEQLKFMQKCEYPFITDVISLFFIPLITTSLINYIDCFSEQSARSCSISVRLFPRESWIENTPFADGSAQQERDGSRSILTRTPMCS